MSPADECDSGDETKASTSSPLAPAGTTETVVEAIQIDMSDSD
jgi:hypothetical protein